MVSLRHHVISLAAVFLALAIGVVLGSGLLSDAVSGVPGLRADRSDLHGEVRALEDQNKALNDKLAAADQFDAQMSGRIVRDALAGKSVALFRTTDAADEDVEATARLIGQAGGTVSATITLTQEFVSGDAADKLGSVVNSPILPAGAQLGAGTDPVAQAGELIGAALLINRDPQIAPVDDEARSTVLTAMRDTGFLSYDSGGQVGPADTAVIITGGALPADAGNRGVTVARFAAGLAPHGSGIVLAGRDGSASGVSAVAVARSEPATAEAVTTVDDIGAESGRITAVLALQSMVAGVPPGRYGVGAGAASVTVPQ